MTLGKKPLAAPPPDTRVSASPEYSEGIAALAWGVTIDEWFRKPRDVRMYMMAVLEGKRRVEHAMIEENKS